MPARTRTKSRRPAPVDSTLAPQLGVNVLRTLRERILAWHYAPGFHLSETALCAEFASSRVPVREALHALVEQGLAEKVPNQGCFVRLPDVDGTQQLYDYRLSLELFVVERLARHGAPPDLLERQREVWTPLMRVKAGTVYDGTELVRLDECFHLELASALGNPYINAALRDVNDRLRFVRQVVITTPHRVQTTAGEHLAVLDAIERGDAEGARRAIWKNLNHARNLIEIAIARALCVAMRR